jgi:ABC-2 type transport system permease protein
VPIFDQGYQHWSGTLSGHSWRGLAIARQGMRVGKKNRFVRVLMLVSWLPALLLAVALCVWGLLERNSSIVAPLLPILRSYLNVEILQNPRSFRLEIWTICYDFFLITELYLSMILVLLVGPGLISQDLRFNALPLYFSRPMKRFDYFLGKLGVIVAFIGTVTIVPSLVAYALGLLFSLDLSIIKDTFGLLLYSMAYGLVIAISSGVLMLALSSLSRNSRYVGLFWLGLWIISGITSAILQDADRSQQRHAEYAARNAAPAGGAAPGRPGPPGVRPVQNINRGMNPEERVSAQLEASKTDWRPLVSYTANLSRVGRQLLGTNAAWDKLSELQPAYIRDQFLLLHKGEQYPWYWSASVLAGLFGLSVCILNFRIKSLDRLK